MEKKSKGIYILVGVLAILCILLAGYIVYDKVFSNKTLPVEGDTTDVSESNLPEWVNYLLKQNITEITYQDGFLNDNNECNSAKNLTKEQLKLILEKMTSGSLRKFDAGGFGGPCYSGIVVKYNNNKFSIYSSRFIIIENNDNQIISLLEKENYTSEEAQYSAPLWTFEYKWDTSYIDTILK